MGSFTNEFENVILNAVIANSAVNTIDEVWIGLTSAAISEADTNATISDVEVAVSNGIARVLTSTSDWNAASSGIIDNANAVTFGSALDSFVAGYFFLSTGSAPAAGGSCIIIAYASCDTAKAIATDDIPQFNAGDLTITLD